MPAYIGRTNQQADVTNFLGINSKSSIVSGREGEAIDIDNWDIDLSGSITRRSGYVTQSTVNPSWLYPVYHLDSFTKLDGTIVYVAIAGNSLYEAASPSGPWIDRGGFFTGTQYVGVNVNGQYVLANGVDNPVVFVPGSSCELLETVSIVPPPDAVTVTSVLGAGVAYQYIITSVTPRGESIPSTPGTTMNGPASLSESAYNTLFWAPKAGAYAQYVYRYNSTANAYYRIAELVGTANSFVDNGAEDNVYAYPPAVSYSLSYNTPSDWNASPGYPDGFFLLSKGKDQRLMAWKGNTYWVSALSNIYDWYTVNDSFAGVVLGGIDNSIKAVASLFDYTILFSETNSFIYSGSSFADWTLSKIMNTGCPSHKSIVFVGDQGIIWSQFGPSTLDRILQGADVQTNTVGQKISPIIWQQTNVDEWGKIIAWHDIKRQRVCFAVPGTGQTTNTMVLAFNYQTKGWTKFSGWTIQSIAYDPYEKENYASLGGPDVVLLHSGLVDGVTRIDNSYSTVYYDARTFLKKRLMFLDVLMDATTPYELDVTINTDFEDKTVPTQSYHLSFDGTTAKTDNEATVMQANKVNYHRIVTNGLCRQVQLVFEDTASSYPAHVYGWRFDNRVRGTR